MKSLVELAGALIEPPRTALTADAVIRRIATDSRRVRPGDLFVAIRGTRTDGHACVAEAVARGAAAVVAERDVGEPGVPVLHVNSSRRALAELAAAWYDRPAERLPLVGITGTLGKTSVLSMLEAILRRAGRRVGTIGSLGVRFGGEAEDTGHTVPGPLVVQRALARMRAAGAELVAMEVTSHALSQERVHGLRFALGIFTNLVPLEHMEYHESFEDYARAKARFFDHLTAGAPLVYSAGDRTVAALLAGRNVRPVGCGGGENATVQVERQRITSEGMRLLLRVRAPLPRLHGEALPPVAFPVEMRLLGRSNAQNAALAAAAALCLGAPIEAVQDALGTLKPPRRRLQVIHRERFTVLDDTVGHPDSITAVFEVAERLPHRKLHVVFAIRGQRGVEVNRGDAEALAIWAARVPIATLVVTRSVEAADERNRVTSEERAAFVERLHEQGLEFQEHDRLEDAVVHALEATGEGDLLLLLGAQGMDAGAAVLRRRIEAVSEGV